uniref:Papilin n=1 Tax=Angiostrongylus cantonensis TaxID=6313 RepID=A0A158P8F4_ANGCA
MFLGAELHGVRRAADRCPGIKRDFVNISRQYLYVISSTFSAAHVVGCDDVIGSSLRFDVCGFCGGRGDGCDTAQFVWKDSGEFTNCSSTCTEAARGFHAGHEGDDRESRSIVVCVNALTGRVVPERLCADRKRPAVRTKPCPPLICPSRKTWLEFFIRKFPEYIIECLVAGSLIGFYSGWLASDWSECMPTCGRGRRTRSVYCVHHTANQTLNVPEKYCTNQTKPVSSLPILYHHYHRIL